MSIVAMFFFSCGADTLVRGHFAMQRGQERPLHITPSSLLALPPSTDQPPPLRQFTAPLLAVLWLLYPPNTRRSFPAPRLRQLLVCHLYRRPVCAGCAQLRAHFPCARTSASLENA